jgi:uncharacterized protein
MENKVYALVTGASSGIGLHISRCLAARRYPLILVSNENERLHTVSRELADEFGVEVQYICRDLAALNAAESLYNECLEKGWEVEVLVNNAGFLIFGQVVDTPLVQTEKMVLLHNLFVGQMCQLFGRRMRERKKGYILNNSSISAHKPFPYIPFYGASKAFIRYLTLSLRHELKMFGVHVTCLSPGATATQLYDPNIVNVQKAMKLGVMLPAGFVAEKAVKGLFANKAEVVPGFSTRLMLFFSKITPSFVIQAIRRQFGHLLDKK